MVTVEFTVDNTGAWREVPDLTMVWSGLCLDEQKLKLRQSLWGIELIRFKLLGRLQGETYRPYYEGQMQRCCRPKSTTYPIP